MDQFINNSVAFKDYQRVITTPKNNDTECNVDFGRDPHCLKQQKSFSKQKPDSDMSFHRPTIDTKCVVDDVSREEQWKLRFEIHGYENTNSGDPFKWDERDVVNYQHPEGLIPQLGRDGMGMAPYVIDSLEPFHFKPEKQELMQDEFRAPPFPQNNVHGMHTILPMAQERVTELSSKSLHAKGSMNNVHPDTSSGQREGFAKGARLNIKTTPWAHYGNKRMFHNPPTKKTHTLFRLLPPNKAVGGPIGTIISQQRGELGHMRIPKNYNISEYHREPMPTGSNEVSNKMLIRATVKQERCSEKDLLQPKHSKDMLTSMTQQYKNKHEWNSTLAAMSSWDDDDGEEEEMGYFGTSGVQSIQLQAARTKFIIRSKTSAQPEIRGTRGATTQNRGGYTVAGAQLRDTQKDEMNFQLKVHPPVGDRRVNQDQAQFEIIEQRRMTPNIQQIVDPSLIDAYMKNPYITRTIPSYYSHN